MTDKAISNVCSVTRSIMYHLSNLIELVETEMTDRRRAASNNNEPTQYC